MGCRYSRRPRFFEAFASALNAHFDQPFTVAELGSGPGHLATVLMRSCNIASYLAIDFSPAMHDLARASLGIDAQRARFLVQDFRDDEWVTIVRGVDAVVTLQAAHEVRHKARLPALLRRIRSVIRPGGLFLFIMSRKVALRSPTYISLGGSSPRHLVTLVS
jgi:SAM-dependent methyltransferase